MDSPTKSLEIADLKPVNRNLESVTITDIENHKHISDEELSRDLKNLDNFTVTDYKDQYQNANIFYGNPTLYHFQFKNLLQCTREHGKSIYDIWNDHESRSKLLDQTRLRNRGGRTAAGNIFECFRINTGSVVMFKSTTAKYLYAKYGAKKVLDPTAGWGGRMLGAWSLGIDYTGIDTNIELKPAYDNMMKYLNNYDNDEYFETSRGNLNMIWQSCLDVDFSKIDYDFVLTSPPYINMEIYQHMTPWPNKDSFYTDFFLPLWKKSLDNIDTNGHVCYNISPKMYQDAKTMGLPEHDLEEDLLQQLGQQTGKKKQDKVYIWKKHHV